MSRRLLSGLLGAVVAYLVVAVAAYVLVLLLSSNTHDRSMEAGMSAVFFYGPVGAVAGFVLGWRRGKRARPRTA